MGEVERGGAPVGRSFGELLYERGHDQEEGRGICVVRVLDLELGGYLAPRLGAQDLLSRNPSVVVHQGEPAAHDFHGKVGVPVQDEKEVEAFIPQEAAGKEGPGRDEAEQLVRPHVLRGRPGAGFGSFFPEI